MSRKYDSFIVHNIDKVKDIDEAARRIQKEFINSQLLWSMLDDLDEVPLSEEYDFHAWCSDFIRVFEYVRTRTWPHIEEMEAMLAVYEEEDNERKSK